MKIVIDGREYPAVSHKGARLLHLIELREQTRKLLEEPLGMARLDALARASAGAREELKAARASGDAAAAAAAEQRVSVDAELWTAIVIFLSRRASGERVTFSEAVDVDLESVEFVLEEGDQPDEQDEPPGPREAPDPTPPGNGGPETNDDGAKPLEHKGKRKSRKGGPSTT